MDLEKNLKKILFSKFINLKMTKFRKKIFFGLKQSNMLWKRFRKFSKMFFFTFWNVKIVVYVGVGKSRRVNISSFLATVLAPLYNTTKMIDFDHPGVEYFFIELIKPFLRRVHHSKKSSEWSSLKIWSLVDFSEFGVFSRFFFGWISIVKSLKFQIFPLGSC